MGPYVLHDELGQGAYATVYRAMHVETRRGVAVKMLRPETADLLEARARLSLEARVLARVRGRHLVAGLGDGTRDDGSPYVVLELLDGPPLSAHLAHGPLPIAAVMSVAEATLDGLEALHGAGIVHRDVKPSNVVLHRDAWGIVPKLVDLGICLDTRVDADPRQTRVGAWVGTPSYMAPEQLAASPVDARTDLYAVGALLYECLTGRTPREARLAVSAGAHDVRAPVPPPTDARPDCPVALERLVLSALADGARDRPVSARQMREALVAIRESLAMPIGMDALEQLPDPAAEPFPLRARVGPAPVTAVPSALPPHAVLARAGIAFVVVALALVGVVGATRDGPAPVDARSVQPPVLAYEVARPPGGAAANLDPAPAVVYAPVVRERTARHACAVWRRHVRPPAARAPTTPPTTRESPTATTIADDSRVSWQLPAADWPPPLGVSERDADARRFAPPDPFR